MSQTVILHAEDDPDDAFFVEHAFRKALPECIVQRVNDGRAVINYLDGVGEFAKPGSNPKAGILLLDLKMADVGGFEVLEWLRSRPQFKSLQVVVLSGSSVVKDKEHSFQLGANAYFVKTPEYADVVAFVAGFLQNQKSAAASGEKSDVIPPTRDSTTGPPPPPSA